MNRSYYLKIIKAEADMAFIRFTAEDMMNDAGGEFNEMKNFFILEAVLHEPGFPLTAKKEMEPIVAEHGRRIRDHIVDVFQKWLNRHTSPDNLLGLNEYNDDPEGTVAHAFVEQGHMIWNDTDRTPHKVDIQDYAYRNVGKLKERGYANEDLRDIKSMIDSGEWKSLGESTRFDIVRMCGPYIFREWKKIFGGDLKEPTKQVTLAIRRLNECSPRELPGAISLSLSVQHVFGNMGQHLDISQSELDYLHTLPQSDIDAVKRRLLDEV